MMTRIHMQDQITNRIEELMNEKQRQHWDSLFQNVATIMIVAVFLLLGLNW